MKGYIEYLRIMLVKLLFPTYSSVPVLTIWAQAYHETGGFTSGVYLTGNNLFGMKNSSRPYDGDDNETIGKEGSATFKNKWLSVYDYFKRQVQFKVTATNFIESTFSSGYAEDRRYVELWEATIEKKRNVVKLYKILSYGVTVIIGFGAWLFIKKR